MSDDLHTFEQARTRLEDIVSQVRRKDCSLEKSLDLLEEGVRLANLCTEKCDHTQWRAAAEEALAASGEIEGGDADAEIPAEESAADGEGDEAASA